MVKERDGNFKGKSPVKGATPRSYYNVKQGGKASSKRGTPFMKAK